MLTQRFLAGIFRGGQPCGDRRTLHCVEGGKRLKIRWAYSYTLCCCEPQGTGAPTGAPHSRTAVMPAGDWERGFVGTATKATQLKNADGVWTSRQSVMSWPPAVASGMRTLRLLHGAKGQNSIESLLTTNPTLENGFWRKRDATSRPPLWCRKIATWLQVSYTRQKAAAGMWGYAVLVRTLWRRSCSRCCSRRFDSERNRRRNN